MEFKQKHGSIYCYNVSWELQLPWYGCSIGCEREIDVDEIKERKRSFEC